MKYQEIVEKMDVDYLYTQASSLLRDLIAIPSFSCEEGITAERIATFFRTHDITFKRLQNNVWAQNKYFDASKPTILLNSHHDTVRPNKGYTRNPFLPVEKDGKLFGLGSNDAGGALVSLLCTFLFFYNKENLQYNIIVAATAEEEISGHGGLELVLPELGLLDFAIVGEPTGMNLAVAERGLMVLDCLVKGKSGHAARNEGENAIYKALPVIEWFKTYEFPKKSELFGQIKMSVTIINAGTQHNVVPDECTLTVDVRVTDVYTHEEILEVVRKECGAEIIPRSTRLKSSSISKEHAIVKAGVALGRETYGSPTTSDQALLSIPSLKMGPGESARSHTADEFIYLNEIKEGISLYTGMLEKILY